MSSELPEKEKNLTFVSQGMTCRGELFTEGDLRIDGKFIGIIQLKGKLVIGEKGFVKGNVKANEIIIIGKSEGEFDAKDTVKILPQGSFKGKIKSKNFNISEDAHFEGTCSILPNRDDFIISNNLWDLIKVNGKELMSNPINGQTKNKIDNSSASDIDSAVTRKKQGRDNTNEINQTPPGSSNFLLSKKINQIEPITK